MQRITLIAVGKAKKEFRPVLEEYRKRLSRSVSLNEIEIECKNLKNEILQHKAENEKIRQRLASVRPGSVIIAFDLSGKKFTSEKFAKMIGSYKDKGTELVFLIGGSAGLDSQTLSKVDLKVSFSDLTFPHILFRLMFFEQLYRGFSILSGAPYHK